MSKPLLKPTPESSESKGEKRKSDTIDLDTCILCKKPCNENKSDFPASSLDKLETFALIWRGLDRYGDIFETVRWDEANQACSFIKFARQSF